jgi:AcrR family transcriptional regulator
MARKAGRPPEDTRRAVLDAAATVIRTRGPGASLDDIARRAGVSKGGLLYHFATKDDLVQALTTRLLDEFRDDVDAAVDPADTAPGRRTRGYVRASLRTDADEAAARDSMALIAQLMTLPEVARLAREDGERWDAELQADGLPEHVLELVIAAADGGFAAPLWGGSPAGTRRLRDQLVRLTLEPERWPHVS